MRIWLQDVRWWNLAMREVYAHYDGDDNYKAALVDLDMFLSYRAWLPENERAYILAVVAGEAPFPELDPWHEWFPEHEAKLNSLLVAIDKTQAPEEMSAEQEHMVMAARLHDGLRWLLNPWDLFLDRVSVSTQEKREILDGILKFWAGADEASILSHETLKALPI